jgi:MFS family permease
VLGRLPIGITGLAILLLVQTSRDSFASGGAATACYITGLAIVSPALGRLIDRYGPHGVLGFCSVAFPSMLVALVVAVSADGPLWVVLSTAASAGATFPPITVTMRTYLKRALGDDPLVGTGYSLESVIIELIFIAGPMIVALLVALVSAAAAVLLSAACGFAGTLQFLRSPAVRRWEVAPSTKPSGYGPLAQRGFLRLVWLILLYSTAFGLMEIGVTAYASEAGSPALAGLLLGVMSAGSAFGGLAYGSRGWHRPLALQFSFTLAAMGLGLAVLALPWSLWWFAGWAVLAGVMMAPALIIQSMLVAKMAQPEHSTEAFTWSTSALLSGVGIGLAAGGGLLEWYPSSAALAAAAATALLAAAGARLTLSVR